MPSENEAWGLSVNEAMAAGLPVIVTDDVGAAADLVRGKGTGVVYPVGNIEKLKEALRSLLQSQSLREGMGRKAKELVEDWTTAKAAQGIIRAVQAPPLNTCGHQQK